MKDTIQFQCFNGCKNNSSFWSWARLQFGHWKFTQQLIKLQDMYVLARFNTMVLLQLFFVIVSGNYGGREIWSLNRCALMQLYWRTLVLMKLIQQNANCLVLPPSLKMDHRFGGSYRIVLSSIVTKNFTQQLVNFLLKQARFLWTISYAEQKDLELIVAN